MAHAARDWRRYAAALTRYLADHGLRDPAWIAAFREVPRHEFTGDTSDDTARLREAYADEVIPTRFAVDDGMEVATSSVSQPIVVATMLEMLTVTDGARVLEIGTGPGYNAALLCQRLGDANVTSVDVQPDLVAEARERLARLDFHPHLEAVDGTRGCPERAPFDRVVATCGLPRIPENWLDQLAVGARVVAPLSFGGAVAVLDRDGNGDLNGHFAPERFYFMRLRDGDAADPVLAAGVLDAAPRVEFSSSELADPNFRLWLELCLPKFEVQRIPPSTDGEPPGLGVRTARRAGDITFDSDGSPAGDDSAVELWDLMTQVYGLWTHHGCPTVDQLGVTVSHRGQWVWCDAPGSQVHWNLPATR